MFVPPFRLPFPFGFVYYILGVLLIDNSLVICLARLGVIFLLRKSDIAPDLLRKLPVAVICHSPLQFQTRAAHITAEGNITHQVHITRRRRIELGQLPLLFNS